MSASNRDRPRAGPPDRGRTVRRASADHLTHQLTRLTGRLTNRDRHLCRLVFDHHVLTTHQLADIAFHSLDRAEERLRTLSGLELLDRFRPRREAGEGTAPYHYVLGPLGAALLAAERGITIAELGWRRDKTLAVAYNQRLDHTVGTNGFFASLIGYARRNPHLGAELAEWWPERRCRATWGELVRPDGYGRWRQQRQPRHGQGEGLVLDFFLEYDNATEPTERVAAKLGGYLDLARAKNLYTPTLFWLPTPGREASIRRALNLAPSSAELPIATANPLEPAGNPAEAVWLQLEQPWPRRRLIDLADPTAWAATGTKAASPQAQAVRWIAS